MKGAVEPQLLPGNFSHEYRYDALTLEQKVRSGFFTKYFLNPSLEYNDWRVCFYTVVAFVLLRFVIAGAVHPRLRRYPNVFNLLAGKFLGRKRCSKISENLWYACWHSFSLCLGLWVLYKEGGTNESPGWSRMIFRDKALHWYWWPTASEISAGNAGWPSFPMSSLTKSYYLLELSFWASCVLYLRIETIRKDFYVLLTHHVVTCTLLIVSYVCSYWRLGAVISVLHDVADVVLYIAKALLYSKINPKVTDILFGLFLGLFFVTRLILFPLFCIRPAIVDKYWQTYMTLPLRTRGELPGATALPAFLCILQVLHIFWFVLIVRIALRAMQNQTVTKDGDLRSEDEMGSDSELEADSDRTEPSKGNARTTNGIVAGKSSKERNEKESSTRQRNITSEQRGRL